MNSPGVARQTRNSCHHRDEHSTPQAVSWGSFGWWTAYVFCRSNLCPVQTLACRWSSLRWPLALQPFHVHRTPSRHPGQTADSVGDRVQLIRRTSQRIWRSLHWWSQTGRKWSDYGRPSLAFSVGCRCWRARASCEVECVTEMRVWWPWRCWHGYAGRERWSAIADDAQYSDCHRVQLNPARDVQIHFMITQWFYCQC